MSFDMGAYSRGSLIEGRELNRGLTVIQGGENSLKSLDQNSVNINQNSVKSKPFMYSDLSFHGRVKLVCIKASLIQDYETLFLNTRGKF